MTDDRLSLPDFIQIPSLLLTDTNLQQLDSLVYGVVYWYSKLKLQRCILKNQVIADLLNCSVGGVANAISRLTKYGYLESAYDRSNHVRELIPLVVYGKSTSSPNESTSSTDEEHFIYRLSGTSSTDESTPALGAGEPNKNKGIRILNNTEEKKYKKREEVLETDFEEIANKYHVSLDYTKDVFESICLWEDEKPGRMKGRNWRATLMNWIRRDIKNYKEHYGRPRVAIITDED